MTTLRLRVAAGAVAARLRLYLARHPQGRSSSSTAEQRCHAKMCRLIRTCTTQPLGIRTVDTVGDELRLNGAAVTMRGFGRHEDFPLVGRGECAPVLVRDHECMRWLHANSYRTAHYPYSEVDLDLADAHGTLVVSESPCVGLSYDDAPSSARGRRRRVSRCASCSSATPMPDVRRRVERVQRARWPWSVPTADAKAVADVAALVALVRSPRPTGRAAR